MLVLGHRCRNRHYLSAIRKAQNQASTLFDVLRGQSLLEWAGDRRLEVLEQAAVTDRAVWR